MEGEARLDLQNGLPWRGIHPGGSWVGRDEAGPAEGGLRRELGAAVTALQAPGTGIVRRFESRRATVLLLPPGKAISAQLPGLKRINPTGGQRARPDSLPFEWWARLDGCGILTAFYMRAWEAPPRHEKR